MYCLQIQSLARQECVGESIIIHEYTKKHNNVNFLNLNIQLATDLQQLQKRRQDLIDRRRLVANAKTYAYDDQPGDQVLKLHINQTSWNNGPPVHIRLQGHTPTAPCQPGAIERNNIRRVKPYRR
jgi:hypothetical protein